MLRKIEIELTKPIQESVTQPGNPRMISSAEDGIQFSKALVEFLKHKAKAFSTASTRVSVAQLKKVFLMGAFSISNEETNGFNGVAYVNLYLRSAADVLLSSPVKFGLPSYINLEMDAACQPNSLDITLARRELRMYPLDRDFSEDDLYFKEDESLSVATTLRNLL
jgi:hypothetical protein